VREIKVKSLVCFLTRKETAVDISQRRETQSLRWVDQVYKQGQKRGVWWRTNYVFILANCFHTVYKVFLFAYYTFRFHYESIASSELWLLRLQWTCCICSLMYVEPYMLTENVLFIWFQGLCKNNLFSDLAMTRTMCCNNNNHVVIRYENLHHNQNGKGGDFELPNRMKTPLFLRFFGTRNSLRIESMQL
jgi:hypothetical protein